MSDRTALDASIQSLVDSNDAEKAALVTLIADTNTAINALLAKIAGGAPVVDYSAEITNLQAVIQKNVDALASIQSEDAEVKVEGAS